MSNALTEAVATLREAPSVTLKTLRLLKKADQRPDHLRRPVRTYPLALPGRVRLNVFPRHVHGRGEQNADSRPHLRPDAGGALFGECPA